MLSFPLGWSHFLQVSFIGFANAWFSEFVGTAMLCGFVMAITDKNKWVQGRNSLLENCSSLLHPRSNPPAQGLVPIALFLFFTGITITWGWLTAFAINPARDLGPRIGLSFVGYGSSADIWTYKHWWWISGVIPADFAGGLFGALIYE
jgi:aquaglyceroporin related protein, other eukaryote